MVVKITDYERIVTVGGVTQFGEMYCPKCFNGFCRERSPEKRGNNGKRREWDCSQCGRGWIEVPAWVNTVSQAHRVAELELELKFINEELKTGTIGRRK